jgi:TolB-like protein/DNA-binding winged helix-turn-helix (wHTH) protein
MQALAVPDTVVFGPFVLDLSARALLAGGEKLALSSRAFDILALLVAERDRVVSKDEILTKVWRGVAVEENNLAVQMSSLRRVLGEHAEGQTLILTVPGQGYRFVARLEAPVVAAPAPAMPAMAPVPPALPPMQAPPRRFFGRWIVALAASLLLFGGLWGKWQFFSSPQAPRLSIAVLPFRNLGEDRKQDYLADAISDDLTTDLSHLPGSVVIARESSDAYKGRAISVERIGRELNVRYLLEGSLRDVGGIFHVNAQLIDASNGAHLWAEAFDAHRSQLAETQAAIVRNIASALDVKLIAIESERSRRERQDNPDAFDLYLQARSIEDTAQTLDQLKAAQDLYERALRLQPSNVDAMADLALLLLEKSREHDDPDDTADLARAGQLIAQALALAPGNVKALTARGLELNLDGKLNESEASLRVALEREPANLLALTDLAVDEWRLGKPNSAADLYERILQLDPQGPQAKKRLASLGMAYFMEGRVQESIDKLLLSMATDATGSSAGGDRVEFSNLFLIAGYDRIGNRAEARQLYAAYVQHWPHRSVWRIASYFSKAQTQLPNFKQLHDGLIDAGMPEFASPPDRTAVTSSSVVIGDFESAPGIIAGASALSVPDLAALLKDAPTPLILDVGIGAATIANSVWIPYPDSSTDGLDSWLAHQPPNRTIIVLGNGFYGTDSYSAIVRIIRSGHGPVKWLIGGEEGLAAAGFPTLDRRNP